MEGIAMVSTCKKLGRAWKTALLLAAIASAGCSSDSGNDESVDSKAQEIVNGEPFWPSADPAHSGIVGWRRRDDSALVRPFGVGVVVAGRRWILTSGHLLYRVPGFYQEPASEDLDQLQTMLGGLKEGWWAVDPNRELGKVPSYSEHPVSQVIFHPDFNPFLNFSEVSNPRVIDAALVRTTDPLPLNWVAGNDGFDLYRGDTEALVGRRCFSISFGPGIQQETLNPNPDTREVLRYGFFDILGVPPDTEFHRPGSAFVTSPTELAPGVTQHNWNGDSGSPCFVQGVVAGILNVVTIVPPPHIASYTKTERYRDWVSRIITESGERDFNGDEHSDIYLRSRSTGDVSAMRAKRARDSSLDIAFDPVQPLVSANGWSPVGTGDFDRDGKVDFVFQWLHPSGPDPQGLVGFFLSRDGGFVRSRPPSDLAYDIVGVADLDADRVSDLIWRNRVNGRTVYWRMNELATGMLPEKTIHAGKAFTGSAAPLGPEWTIAAVADYDRYEFLDPEFAIRDTPDILWRNTVTGENRLALMDWWFGTYGLRREQIIAPRPPEFVVGGVGDYNLDGWADTLLQCEGANCNGGTGAFEIMVRLNPHGPSTPDPARPWRNYEFTALVGKCGALGGTAPACNIGTDLAILGPG
jgi:hypothetical protein